MRSASLQQLQRALRHADTPLTLLWFVRLAALVVVVTASRVLKLERRAPALRRVVLRTARALHSAALATAAVALAWATVSDGGALWRELGDCAPATSARVNGLIAGAALIVHFAACHWGTVTLSVLTLGLVGRASGLAYVLALSTLLNATKLNARPDPYTPVAVMSWYMGGLQLSERVRSECGPEHARIAGAVNAILYAEAVRWGSLALWRMWA